MIGNRDEKADSRVPVEMESGGVDGFSEDRYFNEGLKDPRPVIGVKRLLSNAHVSNRFAAYEFRTTCRPLINNQWQQLVYALTELHNDFDRRVSRCASPYKVGQS